MPSRLDRCAPLSYWREQAWCPFPEWAQFFVRVGWNLRLADVGHQRLVIAVCLPQRGLAASLAALGAVLAEPLPTPTPQDAKQHFEHLLRLPDPAQTPTALTYLHGGRRIRGSFVGSVDKGERRFVKVCVQARAPNKSGGLTHYVQEADAINLQIDPNVRPFLGRHVSGAALVPHREFVSHFYTQDELHLLHLAARCRVVIVGRVNALREETTQLPCAIVARREKVNEGVLNDVLRVRKFITEANRARTAVYATQRDVGPSPEDRLAARLAIFDGADAFVKWGSCFPNANALVILDRTEAMFEEGLSQVNTRYYVRAGEYQWQEGNQIPGGLDGTAFLEVRR